MKANIDHGILLCILNSLTHRHLHVRKGLQMQELLSSQNGFSLSFGASRFWNCEELWTIVSAGASVLKREVLGIILPLKVF